jgi:hypothetical protein
MARNSSLCVRKKYSAFSRRNKRIPAAPDAHFYCYIERPVMPARFKEKKEWQSKFCTEKIRVRQFCAA